MKTITELENGNKVVQAKVWFGLFITAIVVLTILQLTGVIHISHLR